MARAFCVNGGRVQRRLTDVGLAVAVAEFTARMHAQGFLNMGDAESDGVTVRTFRDLDGTVVDIAFGEAADVKVHRDAFADAFLDLVGVA